jgi:hypothetical protein
VLKDLPRDRQRLKFIRGECLQEGNTLTFVVQSQAAGLAKRVSFALFKQTDLRLEGRVRGEADDVDEDDECTEGAPGGRPRRLRPRRRRHPT